MRGVAFIFAMIAALCLQARAEDLRKVHVPWAPVENAALYEFELAASADMEKVLARKNFRETKASLALRPGTYYFRVRAIDATENAGPWSDVSSFVVTPRPPAMLRPVPQELFKDRIPPEGIEFSWQPSAPQSRPVLQIVDPAGWITKREMGQAQRVRWRPPTPGRYQWRIAYATPAGEDGGQFQLFTVLDTALAAPPAPPPTLAEVAKQEKSAIADDEGRAKPQEFWLIARGAQGLAAFSFLDGETGSNANGAALVMLGSAELRWRQAKRAHQPWVWSGSVNFEMISQSVLGTSYLLPRGYARVFYGRDLGAWKLGPLVQAQAGNGLIFLVQDATTALQATALRFGGGAGGFATFRASSTLLVSALALGRADFGGSTPFTPTGLAPSFGFEAGFGLGLGLSPRWLLEGRLRAVGESYAWRPATGGVNSFISDTYIVLDVGVGWRF